MHCTGGVDSPAGELFIPPIGTLKMSPSGFGLKLFILIVHLNKVIFRWKIFFIMVFGFFVRSWSKVADRVLRQGSMHAPSPPLPRGCAFDGYH